MERNRHLRYWHKFDASYRHPNLRVFIQQLSSGRPPKMRERVIQEGERVEEDRERVGEWEKERERERERERKKK